MDFPRRNIGDYRGASIEDRGARMSFRDIKGQDRPIEIIKEHIKQSRLGHAYLFTGPEGVGKKLTAETLAKALNCQNENNDSCDNCSSCLKIEKKQHPDIHFLDDSSCESGAPIQPANSRSIKIEDIRNLQKNAFLRPYEARIKVFIIDNAHNLTPEAANALLKILEEPPEDSLIILISSKTALLFKTIISRCQIVKFYPLPRIELSDILLRGYNFDNNLARFLAFYCEGRLGFALKLKDSGIFNDKNRVIDEFCVKNKSGLNKLSVQNREQMRGILNILAVWLRDVYMLKSGVPVMELINIDRKEDLLRAGDMYSFTDLDGMLSLISNLLLQVEKNINIKLLLSNLYWAIK